MSSTSYLPLVSDHSTKQSTEKYTCTDETQHQRLRCRHCTFLRIFIASLSFLLFLTALLSVIYLRSDLFSDLGSEKLVPRDVDVGGIVGIVIGGSLCLLVFGACVFLDDSSGQENAKSDCAETATRTTIIKTTTTLPGTPKP